MHSLLTSASSLSALKFRAKTAYALIALITALCFITLVSSAATHYHSSTHETQECSLCSVVSDKLAGGITMTTTLLVALVILFTLCAPSQRLTDYCSAELFPPSCGPPT